MKNWNVDREEIRSILSSAQESWEHYTLTVCEPGGAETHLETLVDRVEGLMTKSFSAGYDYAKNEESLVNDAVEALSE